MGSISLGLQAGAEVSEIILLVMTEKGMDALLSTSFKLGADASVAAGPVGAGAKAQTTDILAFARSSGLFGGISIEGAVITSRDAWNRQYYGRNVRAVDIIIRRNVSNPGADALRNLVAHTLPK
jgi:lipid-binding SYLF domain-containing protein